MLFYTKFSLKNSTYESSIKISKDLETGDVIKYPGGKRGIVYVVYDIFMKMDGNIQIKLARIKEDNVNVTFKRLLSTDVINQEKSHWDKRVIFLSNGLYPKKNR